MTLVPAIFAIFGFISSRIVTSLSEASVRENP
jgi:hypothetical protein